MKISELPQEDQQIIYLMLQEHSAPEIAVAMNMRFGTVKKKQCRIYKKVGVNSKVGLLKKHYDEELDSLINSLGEKQTA